MILCSPTPNSIIKASLLAQIYYDLPCLKGEEESLGLFLYTNQLDADKISLKLALSYFQEFSNRSADWILEPPGQEIAGLIISNLRYNSPDKAAVVFAAIEEALHHGYSYCLCGASKLSKLFLKRAKFVSHEIHRMMGFIRFYPAPDNTLVAQPRLYHHTADIILKKFVSRYPKKRLVFIVGKQALILENNHFIHSPAKYYDVFLKNDRFEETWETYYQSQYIAARKNLKLAQRCIPKKYWDWLQEGKFLTMESQNS